MLRIVDYTAMMGSYFTENIRVGMAFLLELKNWNNRIGRLILLFYQFPLEA